MIAYPQPGDSFGRYDIVRRIGRGGMGVVFEAVHRDLKRPVAIKLLSPDLADAEDYRNRFGREAEVLARLDSSHIVRVFDAGEQDGWLFIATELVPGGDLAELLRDDGALDAVLALDLVGQVAEGLAATHELGVLHRDIKPSNVLLRRRGVRLEAVLCDLGISAILDGEHTKTSGVIGTLGYMAPERHEGEPATEASDLYSLGCLLFALLTGSAPYVGTDVRVAMGHMYEPVPQLDSSVPDSELLNPFLAVAMAKDPAQRFGSAESVRREARGLAKLIRDGAPDAPTVEVAEPEAEPTIEETIKRPIATEPEPTPVPAADPTMLRTPVTPVKPTPAPSPKKVVLAPLPEPEPARAPVARPRLGAGVLDTTHKRWLGVLAVVVAISFIWSVAAANSGSDGSASEPAPSQASFTPTSATDAAEALSELGVAFPGVLGKLDTCDISVETTVTDVVCSMTQLDLAISGADSYQVTLDYLSDGAGIDYGTDLNKPWVVDGVTWGSLQSYQFDKDSWIESRAYDSHGFGVTVTAPTQEQAEAVIDALDPQPPAALP